MIPVKFHILPALAVAIHATFLTACSTVEHKNQDATNRIMSSMVQRDILGEAKILDIDTDGCTWVAARGSVRFGEQDT